MKKTLRSLFICFFLFLCSDNKAEAFIWDLGFIGIDAQILSNENVPSWQVIDFSEYSGQVIETRGPLNFGVNIGEQVEWSANASCYNGDTSSTSCNSGALLGDDHYDLGNNGYWDSQRKGFLGTGGDYMSMSFMFDEPVSGLGFLFNGKTPSQNNFEAIGVIYSLSQNRSFLMNVVLPSTTDSLENNGDFIAFKRKTTTDIYGVSIFGSHYVIDNLSFTRSVVPEPTTIALFGTGLLGAFIRRKFLS